MAKWFSINYTRSRTQHVYAMFYAKARWDAELLQVFFSDHTFSLNTVDGRLIFMRILYNFIYMLQKEEQRDEEEKLRIFMSLLAEHHADIQTLNAMTSKRVKRSHPTENTGAGGSDVRHETAGATSHGDLIAHGYELEPQTFINANGDEFEPLTKVRPFFTTLADC